MSGTNLSFAKIVATPTLSSWSQAYNAGSLFIVLSLISEDELLQEELPQKGKQILTNLEVEFFGLEKKTFETIQKAISESIHDLADEITLSLSLAYCKEDTLFCFIIGNGRITLKRNDKIGVVLEELSATDREIKSSSGYLETDDVILIQTAKFSESVPAKTILEALDNTLPNDIAETISPSVHGGSEGGASAIVLSYKGIARILDNETVEEKVSAEDLPQPKTIPAQNFPINPPPDLSSDLPARPHQKDLGEEDEFLDQSPGPSLKDSLKKRLSSFKGSQLPRRKKMLLAIALILVGSLLVSIVVVENHSQSNKDHQQFLKAYNSAKKDYSEGEGLLSLNKALALEDYRSAKVTLDSAQGKLKAGSNDAKQLADLKSKVDKRLNELGGSNNPTASEVDASSAPILKAFLDDSSLLGVAEEDGKVYELSSKAISSENKTLVKNDNNWNSAKALGTFSGNFYVLDPKNGLLKFVPTGNEYATSTYFKGDSPDLKNAVSLSIDSSIYILFSDGNIQKYTRGEKDSFSLINIQKSLSSPTYIYTSSDLKDIYILDNGNSRIIKIDKTGSFVSEYASPALKVAKAISVSNDEKTAYILSSGKIYKLSL